ncbi:MAG TPA: hypothetical protein VEI96_01155 [Thermodesulfovibrionales bacterium]|nr:hypothetical protein [Thermodesulfovibrionales bacterium]
MSDEKSRLVYSTERAVPRKQQTAEEVPWTSLPPAQQKVTIRLDRKGRGGKVVTVIAGLQMEQKDREILLRRLKTDLGTGGTVKDASLEIQGDHRDALMRMLEKIGCRAKRSGG